MGDMGLRLVAPKSRQSQISAEQQSIGSLSLSLFLSLFLSLSLSRFSFFFSSNWIPVQFWKSQNKFFFV